MFQVSTKSDRMNIVVCTHNDADHANGILGFLEAGLGCDEVWLPGRWLDALPHILKPLVEVFDELEKNIIQLDRHQNTGRFDPDSSLLEKYGLHETRPLNEMDKSDEGIALGSDGWPSSLTDALEQSASWWLRPAYPNPSIYFHKSYWRLNKAEMELLWAAIDAANLIREISAAAFHRSIPVRWFEFDPMSPSGGNAFLEPLNAKAVARVNPLVNTLLYHLYLTISNKESLVFWSPPTDCAPGVLFNADSDLANVTLPSALLAGSLATSPHHGSESNANAYVQVAKAAGSSSSSILWVRSDCRSKSRPGKSYLGLPQPNKFCTMCRLSTGNYTIKSTVSLSSSAAGSWQRSSAVCTCK